MVTAEQARQFALSLPGVEEYDHVGRPAFRANGRTFATMWVADRRMNVILSQIDQSVFCSFNPKIVYPVPNKWGSHHGATLFELDLVPEEMLQDAITTGYQTVMDKKTQPRAKKEIMKQQIKIIYMAALAVLIWLALVIQFYISTIKYMADGRTFGGAQVQLLSYFTIQNNLLVALALTLMLLRPASKWGQFFSKPSVLGGLSLYIVIVGLVYQVILRKEHTQHGWFRFCDEVFHSVSPPAFLLFWLIFITKGNLPWTKAFNWLVYPFIYFIYIIARGAMTGYYPYSFIDGNKLSYGQIGVNFIFLLITFLIIGFGLIGISRLAKNKR